MFFLLSTHALHNCSTDAVRAACPSSAVEALTQVMYKDGKTSAHHLGELQH